MKRVYKTPKAVLVDFCYDEQVVADSSGVALFGDPNHIGNLGSQCEHKPVSLLGFPVA